MSWPSETQQEQAKRYLAMKQDELYALIPIYLPEYDGVAFAPQAQIQAGRAFFERILRGLRKAVCEDFDWPSKRNDPGFSDTVNLVAAIADNISTYVGSVPPFLIASLLVRKGLDSLCSAYFKGNKQL